MPVVMLKSRSMLGRMPRTRKPTPMQPAKASTARPMISPHAAGTIGSSSRLSTMEPTATRLRQAVMIGAGCFGFGFPSVGPRRRLPAITRMNQPTPSPSVMAVGRLHATEEDGQSWS